MAICSVCFRHCQLDEGQTGFCGGRICREGVVTAGNYGLVTGLALDPIEKKPLSRFHPGEMILSAGSFGCNLRCPFCQNSSISWSEEALELSGLFSGGPRRQDLQRLAGRVYRLSPQKLADLALSLKEEGNAGLAFTYNEPLIGYEFVRDTARLIHEAGMVNVLVTNGTAEPEILRELAPLIDAANIDLKGFTDDYYRRLGGNRNRVLDFIEGAARTMHVELTTLIVPGENDSDEEMRQISSWIAGLTDGQGRRIGPDIPLHISRFFPQFHMTDRPATDPDRIYQLVEIARRQLNHVYPGNC